MFSVFIYTWLNEIAAKSSQSSHRSYVFRVKLDEIMTYEDEDEDEWFGLHSVASNCFLYIFNTTKLEKQDSADEIEHVAPSIVQSQN